MASVAMLATAAILVSLVFSYVSARHEIVEVYDARLGQSAKILLLTVSQQSNESDLAHSKRVFESWMNNLQQLSSESEEGTSVGHPYEHNMMFVVYRNDQMLWSSPANITRLPVPADYSGFGNMTLQRQQWRYFQLPLKNDSGHSRVLVAEKQSIRDEMMDELALSSALPQLIMIPLLALLIVLLIGKHFRPITELQKAISQRNINRLDSIYVANPTIELSPLVDALNTLLTQLEQAWQRERRFTRMAAHELKTPLTILRLNAENALMSEDPQLLHQDLQNILRGIERTDRLIKQLLTQAKVGSLTQPELSSFNLTKMLQTEIAELAPLALKNKQELSLSGENTQCRGDQLLLQILFSNLLDNAIRYSGTGSCIDVDVQKTDDTIRVLISDNGKEIPQQVRDKLFENFYRANTEKGDGAGLGMGITQDIAALHGGRVTLLPRSDERNVFCVTLAG